MKIKDFILKQAIKYIVWFSKDGGYVKHAKSEFNIAWKNMDDMQGFMCEQVIELLSLLGTQGDSGSSIGYKLNLLNRLAKFKTVSPLTFKDDEFGGPYSWNGSRQNKRNSAVFKNKDGKFTYNNDVAKVAKYYIGEDNVVKPRDGGSWHGSFMVVKRNGELLYVKNLYIKDPNNFSDETIFIDTYELECPSDWWMSLCKEDDIEKVLERYILDDSDNDNNINDELDFKDGKYRKDIINKIELIGKSMYGDDFKLKMNGDTEI